MSIEAILRLILVAAAALTLFVGVSAYKGAAHSRWRTVLIVLVGVWVILTLGGGIYFTPKIGPLVRTEGLLLALAPIGALLGGVVSAYRKASGLTSSVVMFCFAVLVLIDLEAFYHLNHRLAEIAGELGIGPAVKKYEPTANKDCPANLKSLYFAFAQYVDGNGSLPPADKWMENDEIASKVQKEEWFHCPEVSNRHDNRFGYAYNEAVAGRAMNGKKLAEMPGASHTPLLYDFEQSGKERARCVYQPAQTWPPWGQKQRFVLRWARGGAIANVL